MQTYHEIKNQIGRWSRENFGGQETPYFQVYEAGSITTGAKREKTDNRGRASQWSQVVAIEGLAPLMGIVEEVGELFAASKKEDKRDALGDIAVYLCDYLNRECIEFPTKVSLDVRLRATNPLNGLVACLGMMHHCHLKRFQRIRDMHDPMKFSLARQVALEGFVWHLGAAARKVTGTDLLTLLNETWNNIVKKRDWKKDAAAGGGHTHENSPVAVVDVGPAK